ncbi:hypothetical protein CBS101457_000624 [Exobasidium rhododendri]|nr:hypothetical protein CBS101457_000624 [Exobasidium rhododendri]
MLRRYQLQRAATLAHRWQQGVAGGSKQCRQFVCTPHTRKHGEEPFGSAKERRRVKDSNASFPMAPSKDNNDRHRTQYNVDPFSLLPTQEHYTFPLVTASSLAKGTIRPRKVRMLARDFIHDSLYNPHYGYFSRHAILLPDGAKQDRNYDFSKIKNEKDFMVAVEERYGEFEESLKKDDEIHQDTMRGKRKTPYAFSKEGMEAAQTKGKLDAARQAQSEKEAGEHDRDVKAMAARQVWHTPTELFKPYYARAIARYMIEAKADGGVEEPLQIYEVGAGSGALAFDILEFLADEHPEIYKTATYKIIEISPRLAQQQEAVLRKHVKAGKAKIINQSIFNYKEVEKENCFFIALEVLDNLTHDVVRYSTDTMEPYEAIVSIDESGDMHELWEPVKDEMILRYLQLLQSLTSSKLPATAPYYLSWLPKGIRGVLTRHFPFYPNLTKPHFLPTGSLQLLDVLAKSFPKHRAIISDFNSLPEALMGLNAPVVQTRLEGTMIPVTTYTVQQGFFDIFFPTNFKQLQYVHAKAMHQDLNSASILDHSTFLKRYAETEKTSCKDGSNPMLSWYANASWFLS